MWSCIGSEDETNAIMLCRCFADSFTTHSVIDLPGLPHNRRLLQEGGELCSLYKAKLAAVWCLHLCAGTLFVLLLKFGAALNIICGFLMVVSCWRRILKCIVIMWSFLRLLNLHKLAVRKLDLSYSVSWCVRLWIKLTVECPFKVSPRNQLRAASVCSDGVQESCQHREVTGFSAIMSVQRGYHGNTLRVQHDQHLCFLKLLKMFASLQFAGCRRICWQKLNMMLVILISLQYDHLRSL